MDFALDDELQSIYDEAAKLATAFDDAYWREKDERFTMPTTSESRRSGSANLMSIAWHPPSSTSTWMPPRAEIRI